MKRCPQCELDKPLSCFYKRRKNVKQYGTHTVYCIECSKAAAVISTTRLRRQRVAHINEIKESTPCADCGNFYPAVCMDFDHVRGEKVEDISKMIRRGAPTQKIRDEIAKCELVCANCHRIRTRDRSAAVA